MNASHIPIEVNELAKSLEESMMKEYGAALISGEQLKKALGYRSHNALRQAMARNLVPIPIFKIKNRRGSFALLKDVAFWLASQRLQVEDDTNIGGDE